uniref:RING-type domain-containing protein n=1 Tax=Naja naja TaxID=35670 RepID=A0A8C6X1N9_NAJNA
MAKKKKSSSSDAEEEGEDEMLEPSNAEPSPLDCVICFTPYDQLFKLPKELSCRHIFCLECLARINVSSEDVNAITCPVCRALTVLPPRKGLPGLPTRRDLLEQLTAMPVPPGSVRFDRRRGLLYLPAGNKSGAQVGSKPGPPLNTVSLSVDVGRPPPPGSARRLAVSGWPFYAALSVALLVTVGLRFLWQRDSSLGAALFTVLGVSFLLSVLSSWAQAALLKGAAWQTNPALVWG